MIVNSGSDEMVDMMKMRMAAFFKRFGVLSLLLFFVIPRVEKLDEVISGTLA